MKMTDSLFLKLYDINVTDKIEKKSGANYLSWAYAWAELMKVKPDAQYKIIKFDGKPYLSDPDLGIMVFTEVTIDGETREMWLPVMDGNHNAMLLEDYTYQVKEYKNNQATGRMIDKTVSAATMFDVNKAIMRCLVKNIGMFGLGLKLYTGEDLPVDDKDAKEVKKVRGATTAKKNEYEQYLACLDRTVTQEQWEKVLELKPLWIETTKKNYGQDYVDQLERRFKQLEPIFKMPEIEEAAPLPSFLTA
jgi:hypothetical protein